MDITRTTFRLLWGICASLLLMFSGAGADTTFVAGGNVEGSWSSSGSPYVVTGNLTVLASDSLVIGSGTRVYFAGAYGISVLGYFAANGSLGDSVVFTTDTLLNPGRWRGLSFPNAHDSSFIRYALFEHSSAVGPLNADSLGGAIYCSAGTVLRIEHSSFRYNYGGLAGGAVYYTSATCWMDSCDFYRNSTGKDGGGLFLNNTFGSVVTNVHLRANWAAQNGGGLYTRGTTPQFSHCFLDSNFAQVNGGGVSFKNSFAHLDNSIVFANSAGSHGGGMSFEQSNPEIFDCVIEANYTVNFDGGGAYIWESSPHFLRCQVLYNISSDDGGGIHSYRATSDGLFEQCEVRGNAAEGEGAGIWVTLDGSPVFSDCVVRQNNAGTYGGGVFVRYGAMPTFVNCEIDSNIAGQQGGGLSILQSLPTIIGCRIRNNSATTEGGGLNLWESADATIESSMILDNNSGLSGGGISVNQSSLRAVNCLIAGNTAGTSGGGVSTFNSGGIDLEHCTVAHNGGGELRIESSAADVENCVLGATSGGNALHVNAVPTARITYSTLHGTVTFEASDSANGPPWIGVLTAVNGNGDSCDTYFNLRSDPEFADTITGDWSLLATSSSIGAGNWNELSQDILGNARPLPVGTLPDMGAYESVFGTSPAGLSGLLSGAIGPGTVKVVADARIDTNATVTVAPGTTVLFCGPSRLQLRGNLQAIGLVTDSIRFITDTLTNPGRWRGIEASANASASDFAYFELSDARALSGNRVDGGGLNMQAVSPQFSHSTIRRLEAVRGGAVFVSGASTPEFTACDFSSCSADSGGIFYVLSGAAPTLDGCTMYGSGAHAGGAWASVGATGTIRGSRIEGNAVESAGAGFLLSTSPVLLENNLILNNVSQDDGGGVWIHGSSPQLRFNTISGNSGIDGAGVFMRFGAPLVNNNIIAENHGDGIYFQIVPSSQIRYNCVADNDSGNFVMFANNPSQGPAGVGVLDSLNSNGDPCDRYRNIVLNPLWVSGTGSDFYLSNTSAGNPVSSPCINAGDSLATTPEGTTRVDFVGDSGIPDMGYHAPQLAAPPPPVGDLVIQASADSVKLYWSYAGLGLFHVKTDSSSTGSFLSTVALTTDTTVTLPFVAPIHPTKGFFEITVEPLP